jgi:predicted ATPase/class 3 adenylate cyclase
MPELPIGTVTFLFSDIEGSTRLLQGQGDAWPELLARHQAILRAAFAANGGVEVSTEGDSFFAAFASAPAAVAAALDLQRALATEAWPEGAEIKVRVGMHTGDGALADGTYVGIDVHRASRIAGVSHGGQVLVSDATRALVVQALPEGASLRDLGAHRLRDLDEPEQLWQLVAPGLADAFAPITGVDVTPNNLPRRVTTFLGREREIAEASALLATSRLLTFTGPGGTGKTRLSLEVASRALHTHDAVYFVELGTITEPELVAASIGQALGLPDRGGRTAEERIVDHVGSRRVLLVLDNFEQVIGAAPVVSRLLAAASTLTVLVSSRSVLRISGEQEYAVPPLAVPDPARLPPFAQLSQFASVALFIERARAVKPDFTVTNENAPAVAEICVRLDGLPLAIELAAARVRVLTPQAMLGRLEHRLSLLSSGARDLPERQQTLRGAIAWSHEMLEEPDRALFACLSVFVGGAGIEDVERVCAGAVDGDPLDALDSLVEKSLLRQREGHAGEPRFAMLETIREFAWEQAAERGTLDALRDRHLELVVDSAARATGHLMGSDKRGWLDRLEEDHDNIRAAFARAVETNRAEVALRLGASLWRFWQMRGFLAEGLDRLSTALAMPHAADHPEARADALSAAAGLAYWIANDARSRTYYEEEIEARRAMGDRRGLAEALYGISFTYSIRDVTDGGVDDRAAAYVHEALAIFEELGDEGGVGRSQWALANAAYGRGDVDEARTRGHIALEILERLDDRFLVGWVTYTLALGDLSDERVLEGGNAPELLASARGWLDRSLRIFAEAQDVSGYTLVLDGMALVAWRSGDLRRAALLSGAVESFERTSGTGLNLWNRSILGFEPDRLRDDPELADAWAEGAALDANEAVRRALEE